MAEVLPVARHRAVAALRRAAILTYKAAAVTVERNQMLAYWQGLAAWAETARLVAVVLVL
jgi:hypothetical protein